MLSTSLKTGGIAFENYLDSVDKRPYCVDSILLNGVGESGGFLEIFFMPAVFYAKDGRL